jgi:hypothetical protein
VSGTMFACRRDHQNMNIRRLASARSNRSTPRPNSAAAAWKPKADPRYQPSFPEYRGRNRFHRFRGHVTSMLAEEPHSTCSPCPSGPATMRDAVSPTPLVNWRAGGLG